MLNQYTVLEELMTMPYCFHLLDLVQEPSHFDIPEQQTLNLYRKIPSQLSEHLLLNLGREQADKPSKTIRGI